MIKIKFNNTTTFIECGFNRVNEHVISLSGNIPKNTNGFLTFRTDGVTQLGDFSDYKTIYRELDDGLQFSNDGSIYIPPAPPSLEQVKTAKIGELKSQRNTEEKASVTTDLGEFDFDDDSRSRITGAMEVLEGTDTTIQWTRADNTSVAVGYNDLKAVIVTAGVRCNMLHEKYRTLRDMVNACTTAEEVAEIGWDIINE